MGALRVHLVPLDPTMQAVGPGVPTTSLHSLTCLLVQLQDLVQISLKTQVEVVLPHQGMEVAASLHLGALRVITVLGDQGVTNRWFGEEIEIKTKYLCDIKKSSYDRLFH